MKIHVKTYDANFTAGGLLFNEFKALENILLGNNFDLKIQQEEEGNSVIGIATMSARKRIIAEIKRRHSMAPIGFWNYFFQWNQQELKPKPKVLYLKNRIDVDSFLRSIKLLYKLEGRTRSVNTIKSEISKQKLVSKSVERKTNKNIKRNIYDVNDDIISNLSNYLNSDEIDKIDMCMVILIIFTVI